MPSPRVILFAAFEPSGDDLAAPMIRRLLELDPTLTIHALGGPKMQAAGAHLIETTTEHAKMMLGAATEVGTHLGRLKRLRAWLKEHRIDALVPTDSPAANWSICGMVRKHQPHARVVHLVCPQVWAWATWRVHKLRRLTHHVLCLLPHEVDFLKENNIPGTFVGHPLFERLNLQAELLAADALPRTDQPKLALLPGSRSKEIARNWPTMLAVFEQLAKQHPGLRGVVAARVEGDIDKVRAAAGPIPDTIELHSGMTEQVIAWADAVLVVSGTATLQVAARKKPMVVVFNMNWLMAMTIARLLVRARTFALPNLISESIGIGRILPEFVPHFGEAGPVADALAPLLIDGDARREQLAGFDQITRAFDSVRFADTAARTLLAQLPPSSSQP